MSDTAAPSVLDRIPPIAWRAAVLALVSLLGGAGVSANIVAPAEGRMEALEGRVTVLERVARYQGCRSYLEDKGKDPADCAIIYRDLEPWLTNPEARP
jgi:hypothetical protein